MVGQFRCAAAQSSHRHPWQDLLGPRRLVVRPLPAVWLGMSVTSVFALEAMEQVLEQAAGLRLLQLYFV